MAILDFLKKKKPEDFMSLPAGAPVGYGPAGWPMPQQGFPTGPGAGFPGPDMMSGLPPMEPLQQAPPTGFPQMPTMAPSQDIENLRRQVEALNYKLDSIKAALDAINTRLANIETALRATPGMETKQEGWTY